MTEPFEGSVAHCLYCCGVETNSKGRSGPQGACLVVESLVLVHLKLQIDNRCALLLELQLRFPVGMDPRYTRACERSGI